MKLKEAMGQTGSHTLMHPATNINVQVVQPRTRQASDDSQQSGSPEYERAKKVNKKSQKKTDFEDYTEIETDEIDTYYDYESETDSELTKRIKKLIKAKSKKGDEG